MEATITQDKQATQSREDITKKEQILALLDEIKHPEAKNKLLKLFLSVLVGSPEHTRQYMEEIQTYFKDDPAVRAILIALAYIHELSKRGEK